MSEITIEKAFEKASRIKLRIPVGKGSVMPEDLWDLGDQSLNTTAMALNRRLKESAEEDFLKKPKEADIETKLAFDIVLHVLNTKVAEREARESAAERAELKRKYMDALASLEDSALKSMTAEDLKAKIAALG